jgi:hypothetical protein
VAQEIRPEADNEVSKKIFLPIAAIAEIELAGALAGASP